MGWVRLDDAFYDHQKFIVAGPAGIALWVTALAWSNRNLTDGFIPDRQIGRLLDFDGMSQQTGEANGLFALDEEVTGGDIAARLVQIELFDDVPGGYLIHDYLEYQPSAEQVTAKREKERTRWHRRAVGDAAVVPNPVDSDGTPEQLPPDSAATPRASQPQPQSLSNDKEVGAPNGAARTRGSRIPDTFEVTGAMVEWAGRECPDVDWMLATKTFVAHWKAESRAIAVKRDWVSAWRKWLLKDQGDRKRGSAVRTHL